MRSYSPIEHHKTTTGEKFIIVPAPRFLGCTVDLDGKPVALKYPTHKWDCDEPSWKPFYDLKGLNMSDVESYRPAFILYRLGDGLLLRADQDAIKAAGKAENNACPDDQECLSHQVSDLIIATMPEIEAVEIWDFSNLTHLG